MKINRDNVSIIQADCSVEGNLHFAGYLIVAGSVQGFLEAESVVTREGSSIKGELRVRSLAVAGDIEGDIVADSLELTKTADVKGTVQCARLIVEEGGILNATIKWLQKDLSATPEPSI